MGRSTPKAILLHAEDNVATALKNLPQGEIILFPEQNLEVQLTQDIQFGHKFSLVTIPAGKMIYKYGVAIGASTKDIAKGQHVHLHNMRSLQLEGDYSESIQEGQWKNRHT